MIIGITGGTGCGKTALLNVVRDLGGLVLDCDAIYHELLQKDTQLLSDIESRFPGTVENGLLQRKKLGSIVFNDPTALQDLNKITHGAVKAEVIRRLAGSPKLAAIDAIGLFESGLDGLCACTVAVTAPREIRVERLMARDLISREYAMARIDAQPAPEEFIRRCHHHLENDGTLPAFQAKCLAFFRELGIIEEKP